MKKILTLASLFSTGSLFAQGAPAGKEGNLIQMLVLIGITMLFFYFILWRPERKRRKAMEMQRSAMKPGDKATAMGIIGTIDKILDNSVVLKMIDGSKIEVLKAAISEIKATEEPKKE